MEPPNLGPGAKDETWWNHGNSCRRSGFAIWLINALSQGKSSDKTSWRLGGASSILGQSFCTSPRPHNHFARWNESVRPWPQSTGIESSYFHMPKQVIEPQTASASPGCVIHLPVVIRPIVSWFWTCVFPLFRWTDEQRKHARSGLKVHLAQS